jgi:hypothetical protein
MAENSTSSASKEKNSTRKTAKVTPAQSLEILQAAILQCQAAGITAGVENLWSNGEVKAIIVLDGVLVRERKLVFAINGNLGNEAGNELE